MHIRNRNILSTILLFLVSINSMFGIYDSNLLIGQKMFHFYMIFLAIFIGYYIYRNRINLPFPKEITKDSMEDYQKAQLKRYLNSCYSLTWWGFLPLSMVIVAFFSVQVVFGAISILKIIGMVIFLGIIYFSNKYWTKKYNKQYLELTGKDVEVWFSL